MDLWRATRSGSWVGALGFGLMAGCGAPSAAPERPPVARLSDPIELGQGAPTPDHAFHAEGAGWSAGGEDCAVRVSAESAAVTVGRVGGASSLTLRPTGAMRGVVTQAEVEADGSLALRRPGAVERWRDVAGGGVEQSWTFASRPPGDEVTVRLEASGPEYVGADADGLHFAGRSGGPGLRYGHGTWVDATGARTPVMARWDGGAIVLTVPADVVQRSAFPAVLDPVIAPEFGVDVNPGAGVLGSSIPPALTYDGAHYVTARVSGSTTTTRLVALRATPAGAVLDPTGVLLDDLGNLTRVAAAGYGSGSLVAYSAFTATRTSLYYARFDRAGVALDAAARRELVGASNQFGAPLDLPAVACDASDCLVAWQQRTVTSGVTGDWNIVAARVSPAGVVRDATPIVVAGGAGDQRLPAVAVAASGFLVAWEDDSPGVGVATVAVARVRRDGTVLDPGGRNVSVLAANRVNPAVASDGTNFLVAWDATRGAGSRSPGVYAVIVGADGTPGTTQPLGAVTATVRPAVAFNGTTYLAAWTGSPIPGVRVDRAGTPLDATPRTLATPAGSASDPMSPSLDPLLASDGAGFLLSWAGSRTGVFLAADATPTASTVYLARGSSIQRTPFVSVGGGSFLVAWTESTVREVGTSVNQVSVLRAARVAPTGVVLDPSPLMAGELISNFGGQEWSTFPGDAHLVYYGTGSPGITRVTPAGALTRVANHALVNVEDIAAGVGQALAVGHLNPGPGAGAFRIDSNGANLDTFAIPLPVTDCVSVPGYGVAFNGTHYLAAWCGAGGAQVRVTRITSGGDLADLSPASLATPVVQRPRIASDGRDFLVVQPAMVRVGGVDRWVLAGFRVGASGGFLDAAPLVIRTLASSIEAGRIGYAVVHDGATYVVVFRAYEGAIDATRIDSAGTLLDPVPLPIASNSAGPLALGQQGFSVAADRSGRTLVTYARFDRALINDRVFARLITAGDGGVIDAGGVDASSADAGGVPSDVLAIDAGRADTGSIDSSVADVSVVDTSVADVSVADTSVADVSVADASVADVSVVDASVVDASVADSSVVDASVADSSVADSSVADSSVADSSVVDSSVADVATDDVGPRPVDGGDPVDAGTAPPADDGGLCSARPGRGSGGGRAVALGAVVLVALGWRRRGHPGRYRRVTARSPGVTSRLVDAT